MTDMMDHLGQSMAEFDRVNKNKNNPAGYMLSRLNTYLHIFQKRISKEAEVGINVVGAGSNGAFHLRSISASNPDMLIFNGIDDSGRKVQLLQHHSQMSVMFVELAKLEAEPYRIGFT